MLVVLGQLKRVILEKAILDFVLGDHDADALLLICALSREHFLYGSNGRERDKAVSHPLDRTWL